MATTDPSNPNTATRPESIIHHVNYNASVREELASGLILIAAQAAMTYYISKKLMFGSQQKNKQKTNKDQIKTFADVQGIDEAKQELINVVSYLKNPTLYESSGATLPRGILLHGSPGTGKTLLAKAVAGESNAKFFATSGSDFDDMYVGVGAAKVRALFQKARDHKGPSIIFIDEIDSIGSKRTAGESRFSVQTLNQLLAEMDGFHTNDVTHASSSGSVVVIAATNRLEELDPALIRSGRFDLTVHVPKPHLEGRKQVLNRYIKKAVHQEKKMAEEAAAAASTCHTFTLPYFGSWTTSNSIKQPFQWRNIAEERELDVIVSTIAARTVGMSGADLSNIVNAAMIEKVRRDIESTAAAAAATPTTPTTPTTPITSSIIDLNLFEWACDRHLMGRELLSFKISPEVEHLTAHHEAGHALVACLTKAADTVHKMTVVPRANALGYVMSIPCEGSEGSMSRAKLVAKLDVLMGGRCAEEILVGVENVSTGCSSDLKKATSLARMMVEKWGMTINTTVDDNNNQQSLAVYSFNQVDHHIGSEALNRINNQVQALLRDSYERAKSLILFHAVEWKELAQELIAKKTLSGKQIRLILAGGNVKQIKNCDAVLWTQKKTGNISR